MCMPVFRLLHSSCPTFTSSECSVERLSTVILASHKKPYIGLTLNTHIGGYQGTRPPLKLRNAPEFSFVSDVTV
ncbi:hypothetical protein C8Q76DRAFT_724846 [Earliella scabrosa]|nr:hypothetical protein C8Q76DRAFT_724846 [Earliella scabrosa]